MPQRTDEDNRMRLLKMENKIRKGLQVIKTQPQIYIVNEVI